MHQISEKCGNNNCKPIQLKLCTSIKHHTIITNLQHYTNIS